MSHLRPLGRWQEEVVFRRYKELWFGVFFGIGAIAIDALMHARMEASGNAVSEVLVYRTVFLIFGIAIGWLLWRKAAKERELRVLREQLASYRQVVSPAVAIVYADVQALLLTTETEALSTRYRESLQALYNDVHRLKSATS